MVAQVLVGRGRDALTQEMIAGGQLLVERLRGGLALTAAFWLYLVDEDTWRLHLASLRVNEEGPRKGYIQVQNLLEREYQLGNIRDDVLALDDISIIDAKHPLVLLWRKVIGRKDSYQDTRVRRTSIDGRFFEDAYIYFIS